MITKIRFGTLLDEYKKLRIDYIKLNPISIFSIMRYTKLLATLVNKGFEIINLSKEHGFEVLQVPRFAWEKFRRTHHEYNSIVYGAGSIWKLSVHPLKGILSPQPREVYLVEDTTLLITRTGEINVSGLFLREHNHLITKYLNVEHTAFTEHLLRIMSNDIELLKYMVTFLNSDFGRDLSNIAWFGTLQPQLDPKIIVKVPIPLPPANLRSKIADYLTSAYMQEIKAWRAYFKAMKTVEEYISVNVEPLIGVSSFKEISEYGRLDSKYYIYLSFLRHLSRASILKVHELFDVKLCTAPRSRKYKYSPRQGEPYVSYDAIDDSGFVDEELFYTLPNPPKTATRARKFSLLITAVAHSVEGIGKVGILYPYDNMLCMAGLAILNPSSTKLRNVAQKIDYLNEKNIEELMLYTFAILKSQLMRNVMKSLTYGLTAQISKKDVENLPIPLVKDLLSSDVPLLMKEFIENMYTANRLKKMAITELETSISKFLE